MPPQFLLALSLLSAASLAACIASPNLDPAAGQSTGAGGATRVSGQGDDRMVLISATTFTSPGALTPASPGPGGEDSKKDDGKKGKPDAGAGGVHEQDAGTGGGSSSNDGATSSPITVPAFWIDVNEVSAAAYAECVRAGACTAAATGDGCTGPVSLASHPVNCVTIDQARAFCASRGKRLVTNDEWTAAAAGASLRPYPWGSDSPSAALLNGCGLECGGTGTKMYPDSDGWAKTAPRGSFLAGQSPDGVFDLAGNVAEWVDLAGTSAVRGGSWQDGDVTAASTLSMKVTSSADATIGFRCARD